MGIGNRIGNGVGAGLAGIDIAFDFDLFGQIAVDIIIGKPFMIEFFAGIECDRVAAAEGDLRSFSVIVVNGSDRFGFIAGGVGDCIIDFSVFFFALYFVGDIAVIVVFSRKSFFFIRMVERRISVGIGFQTDDRCLGVFDNHGSCDFFMQVMAVG